jgi:hypothetical protein
MQRRIIAPNVIIMKTQVILGELSDAICMPHTPANDFASLAV